MFANNGFYVKNRHSMMFASQQELWSHTYVKMFPTDNEMLMA